MKRASLILAALAWLIPGAAYPIGLEFRPYFGRVTYEEHAREVAIIDSDWTALLGGMKAEINEMKASWYAFALEGTIWTSDRNEEEWNAYSFRQTNDLSVWGAEGKALLGITLPIAEGCRLTPLGGVSYRYQTFTRNNFKINYIPADTETVTEKYPLFSAGGGLNAEIIFPKGFGLFGRVLYFDVISSRAENSLLGDIKGEGGYIWTAEAGMEWTDGVSFALGAAASYEFQSLDGGMDDSDLVEWPENKLESIALVGAFRFFF